MLIENGFSQRSNVYMVDHMYGRTIWPYIWPYNIRLHFSLYGILPYIWLSTKYMAPNHIIWFKTMYMVVYSVWESTGNSKSASEYARTRECPNEVERSE